MAVDFREDRWFVYDMTRKASSNNDVIGRVLQDIKTKLDLIAQQDDCPICLEALDPGACKVLGCCHKTCLPCWDQWTEVRARARRLASWAADTTRRGRGASGVWRLSITIEFT